MRIEQRLAQLGLELPAPSPPAGTYVRALQIGNMVYISGTGPVAGMTGSRGKLGRDVTVEQGYQAAQSVALKVLATLRDTLGDLDRIKQVVKTLGMVNAVPDFTDHVRVINGYADLFVELYGEKAGKGARSAVGMGSLPGDISVEIEGLFMVE
jgi:enamine deaminase RidA (YjgF/YER057c/UK114 family)